MTRFDPKNGLVHIVKGVPWDRKHDGMLYFFKCGGDLIDFNWIHRWTLQAPPDEAPPDEVPTCLRCLSAD